MSEELYDGKKTTSLRYEYDADGNRISETGKIGTDKVQLSYEYTIENRLEAVYDADELLVAMAYDGDGNRVFQLNYNLHTDDDWKGNSGNGNGSNKDNAGSGNNASSGSDSSDDNDSSTGDSTDNDSSDTGNDNSSSNNGNNGNGNGKKDKTNNGNSGNSSANNGKGGNGKNNGNTKKSSNANNSSTSDSVENTEGSNSTSADTTTSSDSATGADFVATVSTTSTGNGNATNAEENNSQNQCGILFPVDSEVSDAEASLIDMIKTEGKQKNYELIEYINDVNRAYTEVLVEQNINGKLDTAYVYGNDRLSLDRFDGSNGYYLYDPRGSVTGITNEEGQIYQSYRYDAFGAITFGAPQYENEYTYNGESYNPNIESQYLRARYYDVVNGNFLTEDSYLGDINEPLTLNRYNYCVSSPLNYVDPSGHWVEDDIAKAILDNPHIATEDKGYEIYKRIQLYKALVIVSFENATYDYVMKVDYKTPYYMQVIELAKKKKHAIACDDFSGTILDKTLIDRIITTNLFKDLGWKGNVDVEELKDVLMYYDINSINRISNFLGQTGHETGGGVWLTEVNWTNMNATEDENKTYFNDKYSPLKKVGQNLGNTKAEDGYLFRGSGYIQLTGRYNYQKFSDAMKMKYGVLDSDIMTLGANYVAENYAWEAAGYFWDLKKINNIIDTSNNPDDVSEKVNKYDKASFKKRRDNTDAAYEVLENRINVVVADIVYDNYFDLLSQRYGY